MVSPGNPYSPPDSAVADVREPGTETQYAVPGIRVEAGRGATWIGDGWRLFKAAPLLWIVALVILLAVQLVLSLIPVLGPIANSLIYPVFMLGILVFARGIAAGEEPDIAHLFTGFRDKLGPLLMVGLLYLLMIMAVVAVLIGLVFALVGDPSAFDPVTFRRDMNEFGGGPLLLGLLAFLVFLGLGVLVAAAYWFAPGLVYYADLGAWAAMKESFRACLHNWLPFLVYGVLALLVVIAGFLAVFIGFFLVSMPVLMASYYSSFEDVFGRKG
ncbi:MAG: hypothetical protein K0S16_1506 [Moraxellaceae bacterium]|jgi:uncharacterized membrane protein|nr:hypothetical protein [Moraxellaceae bacterium]